MTVLAPPHLPHTGRSPRSHTPGSRFGRGAPGHRDPAPAEPELATVAQLRAAIARGVHEVDARQVAEAIAERLLAGRAV